MSDQLPSREKFAEQYPDAWPDGWRDVLAAFASGRLVDREAIDWKPGKRQMAEALLWAAQSGEHIVVLESVLAALGVTDE